MLLPALGAVFEKHPALRGPCPKLQNIALLRRGALNLSAATLHPPGSPLSQSLGTLLRLLSAPYAATGSSRDGDAPARSWVCVGRTCAPATAPQRRAGMLARLGSLQPQQVHPINGGISKALILPLAQFKASLCQEVPHSWPGMPYPGAFLSI